VVVAATEEERSEAGGGAERGDSVALAQQHVEPEAGVARRPSATSDRGRPANAMDGPWIRSWVDGRVRGASGAGPRATAGGRRCAAARGGRADQRSKV